MPYPVLAAVAVRDAHRRIIDFRVEYANAAARAHVDQASPIGKPLVKAIPGLLGADLLDSLRHVVETSEAILRPGSSNQDVSRPAMHIHKHGDGVVVTWHEPHPGAVKDSSSSSALFDDAGVGIHRLSMDGIVLDANQAELAMLGYERGEFVGRPIADFHADPEVAADVLGHLRRGESVRGRPCVMRCKDGSVRHVLLSAEARLDEGRLDFAHCVVLDRTSQRTAEAALKESELRFRTLADAAPVLIWMSGPANEGIYFNQTWLDFTGHPAERQLGDRWLALVHPDDRQSLAEVVAESFRLRRSFTTEFRLRRADGQYCWMLDAGTPRIDATGDFVGFIGSCVDITDRKKAEQLVVTLSEDLRERLEERDALLRILPVGIFVAEDADCTRISMNPAGARMLGIPEDANPSLSVDDAQRPPFRVLKDGVEVGEADLPMQRAARTGQPVWGEEFQVVRRDGSVLTLYEYAVPLFDSAGCVRSCLGVFVDITDLKQAEQTRAFLAAIVESTDDAVVSKTLEGRITSWNAGAQRIFGYTPAEAVGHSINLIIPPELQEEERMILAKLRRGEQIDHYETVRVAKDGRRLFISLTSSPIRDSKGRIVGASKVARDITVNKRAERALQESEQRFRLMADGAPVLIWVTSANKLCTWFNEAWLKFVGRSMEDEIGNGWTENVHPEDLARYMDTYAAAFATRRPFSIEYRLRRRDGEFRWMLNHGVPMQGPERRFTGFIGSCVDITDRKQVEAALKAKEAELDLVAKAIPVMLARCSRDLRYLFVNRAAAALIGLPPEEIVGRSMIDVVGAEAYAVVAPHVERVLRGESVEFEVEFPFPTVGRRWVRANYIPDLDEDGRVAGWIASAVDITARKRAEIALQESEERFRELANNIDQFAWTCDELGNATWFNQRWYEYTGTTFEEMRGWGWKKVHHPDHVDHVVERVRQAWDSGKAWEESFLLRSKDGEYRWFLTRASPILDAQGKVVRWFGTNTDVTDQRRAEEALRTSEQRLRLALRGSSAAVWSLDLTDGSVFASDEFTTLFGFERGAPTTHAQWLSHVHTDDREAVEEEFQRHLASGESEFRQEFRILHPVRGERWILGMGRIERRSDGTPTRVNVINIDITERKEQEEQMRTVMAELNHRVKNTLAVIQSIAGQTLRGSSDMEAFKTSFERRLRSIASAHALLTSSEWQGAMIHDIIASELDSSVGSSDQRTIKGPPLMLRPKIALAMHMVIHELTTNACKYGALSSERGRIDIEWSIVKSEARQFRLVWTERCDHEIEAPSTVGYGSRLMEQLVEYELEGELQREFNSHGLQCRVTCPLSGLAMPSAITRRHPPEETHAPRVLVVEDNATLAMGLCDELRDCGYAIIGPAATLADATDLAQSGSIDAVLLDVDLGGTMSYPLARELRDKDVPFVLLTGYNRSDLPDDLQCAAVLNKPVFVSEVCKFIQENCRRTPGVATT